MNDPNKRKKWKNFVEKYKVYFKSFENIWDDTPKEVEEFIHQ